MPRRFSHSGRTVILAATNAAALAGAEITEAEHVLLALLTVPGNPAGSYLGERGLTRSEVEHSLDDVDDLQDITFDDEDRAALATLGFDVPELLGKLTEQFGDGAAAGRGRSPRRPGPRRSTARLGSSAVQVVEQALFEARLTDTPIGPEHFLLALLQIQPQSCAALLASYEVTYEDAHRNLFPPEQRGTG